MSDFTCDRARECLDELLDGEIGPRDLAALKVHLDVCESCRDYRQLFAGVDELMQHAPLPPMDGVTRGRALAGRPARACEGERGSDRRLLRVASLVFLALFVPAASTAAIVGLVRHHGDTPTKEEASPAGPLEGSQVPAGPERPGTEVSAPESEDVAPDERPGAVESIPAVEVPIPSEAAEATAGLVEGPQPVEVAAPTPAETAVFEGRLDDARQLALASVVDRPDDPATIDSLTLLAQAYRGAHRYEDACGIYSQLIELYPRSEAARTSRVALGQVELGALERPLLALEHFDAYLVQEPAGALAEDARVGRVRALQRLGDAPGLVEAATDYLDTHPAGSAAPEVLGVRGQAHQSMGAQEAACADFESLLARWPESPYASLAREGTEACEEAP